MEDKIKYPSAEWRQMTSEKRRDHLFTRYGSSAGPHLISEMLREFATLNEFTGEGIPYETARSFVKFHCPNQLEIGGTTEGYLEWMASRGYILLEEDQSRIYTIDKSKRETIKDVLGLD